MRSTAASKSACVGVVDLHRAATPCDGIDLVDEDDGGPVSSGALKQPADLPSDSPTHLLITSATDTG
jgi:hypothetical protein